MSADDTPDIVESLVDLAGAPSAVLTQQQRTRHVLRAAAAEIIALRAAQSPQARDEGGAVEGWVLVPREPTEEQEHAGNQAASSNITPDPEAWFSGDLAASVWRAMLAAAPSPPTDATDAINTAEGEAGLAQRGETATGLMRKEPAGLEPLDALVEADANLDAAIAAVASPPAGWLAADMAKAARRVGEIEGRSSPPQAPQDVASPLTARNLTDQQVDAILATFKAELPDIAGAPEWRRAQRRGMRQAIEHALEGFLALTPRELTAGLQKMQTTAPRELTDEEAERGARAYQGSLGISAAVWDHAPEVTRSTHIDAFHAGYRAITEEPAR